MNKKMKPTQILMMIFLFTSSYTYAQEYKAVPLDDEQLVSIYNKKSYEEIAKVVKNQKINVYKKYKTEFMKMYLVLKGVYIFNNILYFNIQITNTSNIDYVIDNIDLRSTERKTNNKGNAIEDQYFDTLYKDNVSVIKGKGTENMVLAYDVFTLNYQDKVLKLTVNEKKGDRTIELDINPEAIINARIPVIYEPKNKKKIKKKQEEEEKTATA